MRSPPFYCVCPSVCLSFLRLVLADRSCAQSTSSWSATPLEIPGAVIASSFSCTTAQEAIWAFARFVTVRELIWKVGRHDGNKWTVWSGTEDRSDGVFVMKSMQQGEWRASFLCSFCSLNASDLAVSGLVYSDGLLLRPSVEPLTPPSSTFNTYIMSWRVPNDTHTPSWEIYAQLSERPLALSVAGIAKVCLCSDSLIGTVD